MAIQMYMVRSQAGLRFIALAKIYNNGDFSRLHCYIQDNFAPEVLEVKAADESLTELHETYLMVGKIKVHELVNADEHRAVMILETELAGYYYGRVRVSEDYPHLITQFIFRPHRKPG